MSAVYIREKVDSIPHVAEDIKGLYTKQLFGSAPFLLPGAPTVYIYYFKHRNLDL